MSHIKVKNFSFYKDLDKEIDLGNGLVLVKMKALPHFLATISSPGVMNGNSTIYDAKVNGEDIGFISINRVNKDELNLRVIKVYENQRGNGYAQKLLKALVDIAIKHNIRYITLECVGREDAVHCYEKIGFKKDPNREIEFANSWGYLTPMIMDTKEIRTFSYDLNGRVKDILKVIAVITSLLAVYGISKLPDRFKEGFNSYIEKYNKNILNYINIAPSEKIRSEVYDWFYYAYLEARTSYETLSEKDIYDNNMESLVKEMFR